MTQRTTRLLRRLVAVAALAMLLPACTPDTADTPEPSASGSARPDGPVVVGAHEYEPILEITLPVPRSTTGSETTVGLVSLVASGATTELRLLLTPSFPTLEEDETVSVYYMFGQNVMPELWDVENLTSYEVVGQMGFEMETDVVRAETTNGEPILYQAIFPALEGEPETVDLVLHPAWPTIEDVPVTYED